MGNWFSKSNLEDAESPYRIKGYKKLKNHIEACGTTACIAGWACILTESEVNVSTDTEILAMIQLGLTNEEARKLFFESYWPRQFRKADIFAEEDRAQEAAKRIDHFIATNGKE